MVLAKFCLSRVSAFEVFEIAPSRFGCVWWRIGERCSTPLKVITLSYLQISRPVVVLLVWRRAVPWPTACIVSRAARELSIVGCISLLLRCRIVCRSSRAKKRANARLLNRPRWRDMMILVVSMSDLVALCISAVQFGPPQRSRRAL